MKRELSGNVTNIKPLQLCGKQIGWLLEMEGVFAAPSEINPINGEHDYNTCEACQKNLKEIEEQLKIRFEGNGSKEAFPMCCTGHSNLAKIKKYNREIFVNVPAMTARKVIFTKQHIVNNFLSENYYKKITDYIDYAVDSFGHTPDNCGEPLFLSNYFLYLTNLINSNSEIPEDKKKRILEYINVFQSPTVSNSKIDITVLVDTYGKWLNVFPFDLSYFSDLKKHFEKQLPLLENNIEVNLYTGQKKVKLLTKNSLIERLVNITDDLLKKINAVVLYEKGLLTDANKLRLELIVNNRKLKLKKGYSVSSDETRIYWEMLSEWFKDEKAFIEEITPLIEQNKSVKGTLYERGLLNLKIHVDGSGKETHKYDIQLILTKNENLNDIYTKTNGEFSIAEIYLANKLFFLRQDFLNQFANSNVNFSVNEFLCYHEALNTVVIQNLIDLIKFDLEKVLNPQIYSEHKEFVLSHLDKELQQLKANVPTVQKEVKGGEQKINPIPRFKPESIDNIFILLKGFFNTEDQTKLEVLLKSGLDSSEYLTFLDNGNRLADAFKQLKKGDVITGCDQKELESWIFRNFRYKYRQKTKEFTLRYLNDIISSNKDCINPILNVKLTNGQTIISKA